MMWWTQRTLLGAIDNRDRMHPMVWTPMVRVSDLVLLYGWPQRVSGDALGGQRPAARGKPPALRLVWSLAVNGHSDFSESNRVWIEYALPERAGGPITTLAAVQSTIVLGERRWALCATSERLGNLFRQHMMASLQRLRRGVTIAGRMPGECVDAAVRLRFADIAVDAYSETRTWPDMMRRVRFWMGELPMDDDRRWLSLALACGRHVWAEGTDDESLTVAGPFATLGSSHLHAWGRVPCACSRCGQFVHPMHQDEQPWLCRGCAKGDSGGDKMSQDRVLHLISAHPILAGSGC